MRRASNIPLPSKSVAISLGIVAILIAGSSWYLSRDQNSGDVAAIIPPSGSPESAKDSDQDGLKDWEETLWGTDPQNPDTDGNGIQDGEEAGSGMNPSDETESRLVSETLATSSEQTAAVGGTLTPTDQFSRAFFQKFIEAQKLQNPSGRFSDPREIDVLMAGAESVLAKPPRYTKASLTIIPEGNVSDLKTYGNAISNAYARHTAPDAETELVVLNRALLTNNKTDFTKLGTVADTYANAAQTLLTTPVPEPLVTFHLSLINSTVGLSYSVRDMSIMPQDPLRGALGIRSYFERATSFKATIGALSEYFRVKGVNFSSTEDGYMFEILKFQER